MIPTFWAVAADAVGPDDDNCAFYDNQEAAVEGAKRNARGMNRPYAVYKLVQTHYVKPLGKRPDGVIEVQA